MGESPTEFNNEPGNLPTVETQILTGVIMSINWGDIGRHLLAQVVVAAISGAVAAMGHFDFSQFGPFAMVAQAITPTIVSAWNTYEPTLEKDISGS